MYIVYRTVEHFKIQNRLEYFFFIIFRRVYFENIERRNMKVEQGYKKNVQQPFTELCDCRVDYESSV